MFAGGSGNDGCWPLKVDLSQAVDTDAIMIGDIDNVWTVLVARQVVRMNYLTSRLHRKGSYRSTIWCRRDDQDDCCSQGLSDAQKPLPNADNRFSKENYRAEDVGNCRAARWQTIEVCYRALLRIISKNFLPTIPCDVKPYYKANPLAYPWGYMREVLKV